jgi:hypothetical protein
MYAGVRAGGGVSIPADNGDVRIPFVALVITLEADPKIIVSAESEADREALHVWVREIRPDVDELLHSIALELHEKKQAA